MEHKYISPMNNLYISWNTTYNDMEYMYYHGGTIVHFPTCSILINNSKRYCKKKNIKSLILTYTLEYKN